MQIVVVEDEHVPRLYPLTIGRAAYGLSCGSYRLIDWLVRLSQESGASLCGVVRPHLQEIQRLDFPEIHSGPPEAETPTLLVNARIVPSASVFRTLKRILAAQQPLAVLDNGSIAAALVVRGLPADWLQRLPFIVNDLPDLGQSLPLFAYPHDLVRHNLAIVEENLAARLQGGGFREVADGVFAAEGASLGQFCVTETSKGPVLLDADAAVGAYTLLRGPAYLGPKAKVLEHSAIKDAVSLGHTTKIGGEIEASIVEPYTNKQHHGFLGHSYLGSWINLGAGTSNSDLKNTYGHVKMDYRGEQVATGMQFVGCFVGDYAKSAINTGIFTGKTIGCCSMVYGFVTTNVPSFVNYARLFGQVTELPPEVMVATQQRMFARRNVVQRECDIALLHAMYDLTRHERQLAGEPLAL
jgi:UDP-N-acetylglucosamine diphosphorylase / glucose-1-phosphate thymidylyltransferase / UDP-N-acetylgalactosamine diphosphorylase / glucosamine-1-phosphate N-acetyltransferase / galactosamine-1-phosphate N-acetyltransferase